MSMELYERAKPVLQKDMSYENFMKMSSITITSEIIDRLVIDYLPPSIRHIAFSSCNIGGPIEISGDLPKLRIITLSNGSAKKLDLKFSGDVLKFINCDQNPIERITALPNHRPEHLTIECITFTKDILAGIDLSKLCSLDMRGHRGFALPEQKMEFLEELALETRDDILDFNIDAPDLYSLTLSGNKVSLVDGFDISGLLNIRCKEYTLPRDTSLKSLATLRLKCLTANVEIDSSMSYLQELKVEAIDGEVKLYDDIPNLSEITVDMTSGKLTLPDESRSIRRLTLRVRNLCNFGRYPNLLNLSIGVPSPPEIDLTQSPKVEYIRSVGSDRYELILPDDMSKLKSLFVITADKRLDKLTLPTVLPRLRNLHFGCKDLVELTIPESAVIMDKIILDCMSLKVLNLPKRLLATDGIQLPPLAKIVRY